jgi:hypothetical protein
MQGKNVKVGDLKPGDMVIDYQNKKVLYVDLTVFINNQYSVYFFGTEKPSLYRKDDWIETLERKEK